jgi:hypothetical protein
VGDEASRAIQEEWQRHDKRTLTTLREMGLDLVPIHLPKNYPVEYLHANRIRWQVVREMEEALGRVDLYVCPSHGGDNLLLTNPTGHPAVFLSNGFRSSDGTPTSITFNGRL